MQILQCPFDEATLDCYLLDSAKGAVIICPGGGYEFLSEREGAPVARAFQKAGFRAFVLQYSVLQPPLGWRALRQLAWAVSAVRGLSTAKNEKVAVCGFSAGGHLAASLGVLWARPELFAPGADLAKQRPDALILSYPVISGGQYAHRGSFTQLAGTDKSCWDTFSLEKLVTKQSVPAFLWHTATDESVPVQNSLLFFDQLVRHGVAAELHLYPFGAHGMSLATPEVSQPERNRLADPHVQTWLPLARYWLEDLFAGRSGT